MCNGVDSLNAVDMTKTVNHRLYSFPLSTIICLKTYVSDYISFLLAVRRKIAPAEGKKFLAKANYLLALAFFLAI